VPDDYETDSTARLSKQTSFLLTDEDRRRLCELIRAAEEEE